MSDAKEKHIPAVGAIKVKSSNSNHILCDHHTKYVYFITEASSDKNFNNLLLRRYSVFSPSKLEIQLIGL